MSMVLPSVNILICTIAERINNIASMLLPPTDGIRYIVSHQTDGKAIECPEELKKRCDVEVYTLEGKGLSVNRNNAIKHADGDLWIISDDDATYNLEQLEQIRVVAKQNPQADILTFMVSTGGNDLLHPYPKKGFTYPHRPKGFYYNSNEIVLRKGRDYPPFDSRLGLGADRLHMGEEEIFVYECYKRKLRVDFLPYILQTIPKTTTSMRYADDKSLRESKGAVLTLMHGIPKASVCILYTAFKMKNVVPFWKHLHNLFNGMFYILRTKSNGTIN